MKKSERKSNLGRNSKALFDGLTNDVNQATCSHPETIEDSNAVWCVKCGKRLDQIRWEINTRVVELLGGIKRDFGYPRDENTHRQGVTDYDSFKANECQELIDRRSA